jgi:hypothetical protein
MDKVKGYEVKAKDPNTGKWTQWLASSWIGENHITHTWVDQNHIENHFYRCFANNTNYVFGLFKNGCFKKVLTIK